MQTETDRHKDAADGPRRIAMGSDHAGFAMKEKIQRFLEETGWEVLDFGTNSNDSVDYPDHIHPVATAVESGECRTGIILCGSGNGAAITANKHQGIRAALCWNTELARLAREHNDANILALPARYISDEDALAMVRIYLETPFAGGRHQARVAKIPCG